MPDIDKKLAIIGLQQTFLQLVHDQIKELAGDRIRIRTVALNEFDENPLDADETILYFSKGLKTMVKKLFPRNEHYIHARRENLIYNMRDLFVLEPGRRILVVNDIKSNTDEMTEELEGLDLGHTFLPYYPDEALPKDIDLVITAGERMLVPAQLRQKPIIDIGLRFISLETVYALFDYFKLAYTHAALARHYMRTMMMLSEKWPVLGKHRFRRPNWFGVRQDTSAPYTFDDLIKNSPAMRQLYREALKTAATDTPVHLYGGIGTGKTKVAQAIHNASPFAAGPFVSVNCSARSAETLARELFGWEKGAATYKSLFEGAENGTLCIEEIGNLPVKLQARLLQAVTEKRIIRTNGSGVVDIHARLITTSSRELDNASAGAFNPGLLLMITQHVIRVPSLTERMADFDSLVTDYVKNHLHKPHLHIPEDTLAELKTHSWEGNVQELYHVLQHLVILSTDRLDKKYLPYYITRENRTEDSAKPRFPLFGETREALPEENFDAITQEIIAHGFVGESREILKIYKTGKKKNLAYGRSAVQAMLQEKAILLSSQQLRLKLERMHKLGLLIVRPGRGGTTISELGERYLEQLSP